VRLPYAPRGVKPLSPHKNVANSFDSHKITEVAWMQKKYNISARLQCAEEKDDYEWWSEDEQQ
jgi:hypothetical protein